MKTISERLNSIAMDCFCACVSWDLNPEGTWTIAKGFPAYGVLVKTSRVVNLSSIRAVVCWSEASEWCPISMKQ